MECVTIADIKSGYKSKDSLRIYVVEGEGCILYVGKSKNAIERMLSHLNMGRWKTFFGSEFDLMLKENKKSDEYIVTFYNESDVDDMCQVLRGKTVTIDEKVTMTERHLIWWESPIFNNIQGNEN